MLRSHHLVWLEKHPERTEWWLRRRLRDGFHVHHVDGNHDNNSPENLVLIEGSDHMALHGMSVGALRKAAGSWTRKRRKHGIQSELETEVQRLRNREALESAIGRGVMKGSLRPLWKKKL